MNIQNLFKTLPGEAEEFQTLLKTHSLHLEQIISRGQASQPDFWYDQPRPEWIALLRGTAELRFDHGPTLTLSPGDSLTIPAHHRHRVESVSNDALWLALHFQPPPSESTHIQPPPTGEPTTLTKN